MNITMIYFSKLCMRIYLHYAKLNSNLTVIKGKGEK